jgi:hypothetical protein
VTSFDMAMAAWGEVLAKAVGLFIGGWALLSGWDLLRAWFQSRRRA